MSADKFREHLIKSVGLLEIREMTGVGEYQESGFGYQASELLRGCQPGVVVPIATKNEGRADNSGQHRPQIHGLNHARKAHITFQQRRRNAFSAPFDKVWMRRCVAFAEPARRRSGSDPGHRKFLCLSDALFPKGCTNRIGMTCSTGQDQPVESMWMTRGGYLRDLAADRYSNQSGAFDIQMIHQCRDIVCLRLETEIAITRRRGRAVTAQVE
jgi:hypothetical protein